MMKTFMTLAGLGLMACGPPPDPQVPATAATGEAPGAGTVQAAAGNRLIAGGSTSNFGEFRIAAGFLPDPHSQVVVSGGDLDVRTLSLGQGCIGWATRLPDYIMHLTRPSAALRVYVTSDQNEDTTLVINAADGSWHCNDDSYGGRNPTVDLPGAGAGQYDIWVGSYQQGVQAHGTLHITEIASNHP